MTGRFVGFIIPLGKHLIGRYGWLGRLRLRLCGGRSHGNHPADALQFLLGFLQIHLVFLDCQLLPLHLQLRQGGIEAHEQIALFHLLVFFHQDFRNRLGVGQVDGLNPVGGDGAVALPAVPPILGHAHIAKGVHLDGGHMAVRIISPSEEAAGAHRRSRSNGNQRFFKLVHGLLPPRFPAADRPGCGKSCQRTGQWPARG